MKSGVRPACVLSPKPRFSYLDLCCLDARPPHAYYFPIFLSYSFRYFVLYLNTTLLCPFEMIIDVEERRVTTYFPPTLRARPGSQANVALEGHSHFSHSTAAGNPLNLLPIQSPSLPHEHTHALTSAYTGALGSVRYGIPSSFTRASSPALDPELEQDFPGSVPASQSDSSILSEKASPGRDAPAYRISRSNSPLRR
jgi:hypothetical protein